MKALPERSAAATLQPAWLIALVCLACDPGTAEIKGNTARVVGERITLELVEGEEPFSASARLRISATETYDSQQLRVERLESGRKLALSIPLGITAGPALLLVRKEGSPEEYEIPLTIDRLAAFVTDTGDLHLVSLPPATVKAQAQKVGNDDAVLLSLSDDATTVVTASADQLALFRLSPDIAQSRVTGKLGGVVQALAALPNGAVVATPGTNSDQSVVRLYQVNTDDELNESDSRLIESATIKALAAVDRSPQRPKVAILTDCKDGGDCVITIDFDVPANQDDLSAQTLDETSSAKVIAISGDGLVVAVPDNDVIHGVNYAGTKPVLSAPLAWGIGGAADPVGIARTLTPVVGKSELQDVFAAAEGASGTLRLFGAPEGTLLSLAQQPPSLVSPPLAISFGRDREIFVLTEDRQLVSIVAGGNRFRPVDLAVPKGATALAVQR